MPAPSGGSAKADKVRREEVSRVSDLTVQSDLASGTTTVVDATEHIEGKKFLRQSGESLDVPKSRDTELRDLARIIEMSSRFAHVTPEQIERVRMMHDRFADGAKFSFNYNVLLLVASILAGLGLVSNSTTIIIASMLVSPIMGPVVGIAYGTTINDWKLVRRSFATEGLSLLFCVAAGAAISAICGPTQLADYWPTAEMTSRGTWANFLVGLPVAFFSGLGVAVSLLDDQTSSLVGVAISASLLPPAVNAGVIWVAYAFLRADLLNSGDPHALSGIPSTDVSEEELENIYEDRLLEFAEMGYVSLALTLANIALISIASMLMFRMKEVLPIEKKVFWNDLGVARKIYQKRALISQVNAATSAEEYLDPGVTSSSSEPFVGAMEDQQPSGTPEPGE